jgi:uncharacterized membrane protein
LPESERENFFGQTGVSTEQSFLNTSDDPLVHAYINTRARIAIYDDLLSAPRIIDINPAPVLDFIENIASTTYELAQKQGGDLPYSVIREIAENFIHAQFKECTVSVLDHGNTIRFSDQGPGIEKKRLVQQPGITSATAEMKRFIRGVGSGFPIVREYLEYRNGILSIDDNAKEGSVITLSIQTQAINAPQHDGLSNTRKPERPLSQKLDRRSLQVLRLLDKEGVLGPSDLMEPLDVSAATAHRILVGLEEKGLIESTTHRKRILSSAGFALLAGEETRG